MLKYPITRGRFSGDKFNEKYFYHLNHFSLLRLVTLLVIKFFLILFQIEIVFCSSEFMLKTFLKSFSNFYIKMHLTLACHSRS